MEQIISYVVTYIPVLLALAAECGVFKYAIDVLKKAKETKEFKDVVEQNKLLLQELREAQRLNKELLTKIDRIQRGE